MTFYNCFDENDTTDVKVTKKDIIPIDEVKEKSALGPDGIPAIFREKTKNSSPKPVILLRQCVDDTEGI